MSLETIISTVVSVMRDAVYVQRRNRDLLRDGLFDEVLVTNDALKTALKNRIDFRHSTSVTILPSRRAGEAWLKCGADVQRAEAQYSRAVERWQRRLVRI